MEALHIVVDAIEKIQYHENDVELIHNIVSEARKLINNKPHKYYNKQQLDYILIGSNINIDVYNTYFIDCPNIYNISIAHMIDLCDGNINTTFSMSYYNAIDGLTEYGKKQLIKNNYAIYKREYLNKKLQKINELYLKIMNILNETIEEPYI